MNSPFLEYDLLTEPQKRQVAAMFHSLGHGKPERYLYELTGNGVSVLSRRPKQQERRRPHEHFVPASR